MYVGNRIMFGDDDMANEKKKRKFKGIDYIWTDKKRTIFGLPISFTRYFITEEKFIVRKGFLSLAETECELYRITDKKLILPFIQRLFRCGSILLHMKDVDTPEYEVHAVKMPREVLGVFDEQINKQRDKYNIRGRDMVGAGHSSCDSDDN